MSEGKPRVTGDQCNKRIYCDTNNNSIAFIKFQHLNGEKGVTAADLSSSKYVKSCKTKTSSIQTSELTTVLTTIPTTTPATISTAVPTTAPPTQPSTDYQTSGFELISSPSNPFSVGLGKFVGYFQNQSFCKRICEQKRGLLTCIGYMFEPNNMGKCTIYEIGPPIKSMLS
uniref:Apple domain-containing protein n=1 Tax=Panagrolaimus davidi TaxID=227884 RepID=A0A914PR30_9BILA